MSPRRKPEPVQVVKLRRDQALARLVSSVPYIGFLGMSFDRRGDELTAILPWRDGLTGNPALPALHGGVTSGFMEAAAIIELAWSLHWQAIEAAAEAGEPVPQDLPPLPRTINFSVDFLRSGLPRDAYARARIARSGRRYASVHVEAWQDNHARPIAQAAGHFLMPGRK